ncbi:MAG: flippase-like domain-containing protein [Candidatus Aminicenantes bacterium]|nr:flippase-like domain-containing protein [Candidatus Aminicenantes bacterium]
MKNTTIRTGLMILISAVFLFFFFKGVEWKEALGYLSGINIKFFILMTLMAPMHLVTRSLRWHFLIKQEKKGVSLYSRIAANAVGFTVTMLVPARIGEVVRPLFLAQKENIRKGYMLGTIVVERIFDLFTMCTILGVFLLARPLYESVFPVDTDIYSNLYIWGYISLGLAVLLFTLILTLFFFRKKALKVLTLLLKPFSEKTTSKVLEIVDDFIQGLKFFHSIRDLSMYILLSFVVWLGIMFFYWMFFFAFNVSIPYFFLVPYSFMVMVGASIPTPGMVGGFDYFSRLGLTTFFDLNSNQAFGMTIVVHSLQVVVTCLIGYAILWKEGLSLFQVKRIGEKSTE